MILVEDEVLAVQLLVEYDLPYEVTAVVFGVMIKQLNDPNAIGTNEFAQH